MNTLDWIYLAVVVVSAILGVWRGFVREAMSLGGWAVALATAYGGCGALAPFLSFSGFGESGRLALAFVAIVVVTLMLWAVLTSLIQSALTAIGFGVFNRLIGTCFGIARGALIVMLANTVLLHTPMAQTDLFKSSRGAQVAYSATKAITPLLPEGVAKFIP